MKYLAINLITRETEQFDNQSYFSIKHGLTQSLVSRCINNHRNIHKGWIFFKLSKGKTNEISMPAF